MGGVAVLGAQTAPMALPRVAPTVDQVLSLKRVGSPDLSPDGRWVAYTVRETNWDDNAYETRDLAGRRRDRRDPPAHQLEEVEPVARLVARRLEARVHLGPHRQDADLS